MTPRALALAMLVLAGCEHAVPPAPPVPPAPAVADAGARVQGSPEPGARREELPAMVLSFEGTAEVQRAGTTGWVALKIGDAIRAGDAVRTAPGAQLEFTLGEATMRVQSSSEVLFQGFDPRSIRVQVQGHIEAATGGAGRSFELSPADGGALTSLEAGRVTFVADASGTTALAAMTGPATASINGERVELGEGEFTSSVRGKSASRPQKLPSRVSLRVRWPAHLETNRPQLSLRGTASALAEVQVQGRPVVAGPDGTFQAEVHLRRGAQRVVVEARDALGREARDTRKVTFDPDAPSIKGEVEYQ